MFRAQLSAGVNLDRVADILRFGKTQVGKRYDRKQHGKDGGTRCSPFLMGSREHLSQICKKYKDGLLWPRHGSALLVQRPVETASLLWRVGGLVVKG